MPRREWNTGPNLSTSSVESLRYDEEFSGPPEVHYGPSSEPQLRLRGRKSAKYWRDWLVWRLVPDLKAAFPVIGELIYIRNCMN